MVVALSWARLTESIRQARGITQPSRRAQALEQLVAPVAGLLIGAAISAEPEIVEAAVAVFTETDGAVSRRWVMTVLRALRKDDPEVRASSGFDALARNTLVWLEFSLARPPRQLDDWSIELPRGCRCPVCVTLNSFLVDPERRMMDWPLREQSRRHVHERIGGNELPVRHVTRRVGRPYTLQLTKTPALFEREHQERQADKVDLQWLREVAR